MSKLTKEERLAQARKEKEEKRIKDYMNSMVTRNEATNLATGVARQEIAQAWEPMREVMKGNILQTLAIYHLLLDKGIIESEEQFNEYLTKVAVMVEHKLGDEENAEVETAEQDAEVFESAEETEEQQG